MNNEEEWAGFEEGDVLLFDNGEIHLGVTWVTAGMCCDDLGNGGKVSSMGRCPAARPGGTAW
jgi:hypothetical protein